jgi:hypothetical protein
MSENIPIPASSSGSHAPALIVIHYSRRAENAVIPAGMQESSAMDGNSPLCKCLIQGTRQPADSPPCDWIPAVHAGMTGFLHLCITMSAPAWEREKFLFYPVEDGQTKLQVRLHEGTVWLTHRLLAELYHVSVPTVNEHLQGIFNEGELDPMATIRKFLIVQTEGTRQFKGNYPAIPDSSSSERCAMRTLQVLPVFKERNVLGHAGHITHDMAQDRAEFEYAKYEAERRRIEASQPSSDFDRVVEETRQLAKQAKPRSKKT